MVLSAPKINVTKVVNDRLISTPIRCADVCTYAVCAELVLLVRIVRIVLYCTSLIVLRDSCCPHWVASSLTTVQAEGMRSIRPLPIALKNHLE